MRPLALVALLSLCAASARAQAQPESLSAAAKKAQGSKFDRTKSSGPGVPGKAVLDLSGLVAPGQGPSAGPEATPPGGGGGGFEREKRSVRAAVEQIAGPGKSVAAQLFSAAFGGENAVSPADIDAAAKDILGKLDSGAIQVGEGSGMRGTAAYWEARIDGGKWTGGLMGVSRTSMEGARRARSLTTGPPTAGLLCAEDQIGNTVLHETAHIFYTYLTSVKGLKAVDQDVTEVFQPKTFWNGTGPALFCRGDACQSTFQCKLSMEHYQYKLDGKSYGKSANENTARLIADRLHTQSLRAVIEPILASN